MHEVETRPGWIVPMKARSPDDPHRAATPLELFFDLVFVVAVAQAAAALHHGIAENHAAEAIVGYLMVFFGIWWAWMNFTWFASAYDNGDVLYRLTVFVQMTGALIFASGINLVFEQQNFTLAVLGYVVMRVAGITQWMRAAQADPGHRVTAFRYAGGIAACQIAWILLLFAPQSWLVPGYALLTAAELIVPIWAESAARTSWHMHHIRERYGLFTILVLGESVLSISLAIQTAIEEGALNGTLVPTIVGALLIVYAMWWLYFYQSAAHFVKSISAAFIWGYGHLLVFGSTAAVGAGIAVMIDYVTHHAEISLEAAGMALAIPAAIYVLSLWVLQEHPRADNWFDTLIHPVAAVLILLTPFTGQAVLFTGVLLAVLVTIRVVRHLT